MFVQRLSLEILLQCKKNNINIDYLKVQKLCYLCQCVHYGKYGVPFVPQKIFNWSYGGGFKEVYAFFIKKNILDSCDNFKVFQIEKMIDDLEKSNKIYDLFSFEKETIDYVINNYGNKDFDELSKMVLDDDLYKNIKIGDIVKLEKLNNYFIKKEKLNNVNNVKSLKKH